MSAFIKVELRNFSDMNKNVIFANHITYVKNNVINCVCLHMFDPFNLILLHKLFLLCFAYLFPLDYIVYILYKINNTDSSFLSHMLHFHIILSEI